ncbi:hypothetical protein PLICRDRAFT_45856 [Plicaturopsis crispa FD-325 SS-3]|uniref:MYND-type domain-containing protein n=1 Tax=Plicaturopsis crispa FD-325 SS-3 TaxID=944288 RepID=A0A0C9T9Q6_PLICR|nr:hypothetical protein PLICRDRAFT_45856 [Plicaturopsis crispa FD-325 SS-3]
MKDRNNLDAYVQCAFLCPTLDESEECLAFAISVGRELLKSCLGAKCFDESPTNTHMGHFYDALPARPYLRTLQALVRLAFENKHYEKSADNALELMRLCAGDDMGQRGWLGSMLLRCGRNTEALAFAQAWMVPGAPKRVPYPPPVNEVLTADQEEENKYAKAAIAYTGALAAFRVWGGDAPVARQYLRIAARACPAVLIKILAHVEKPSSLNMNPRSLNGAEDAHDYLSLTQDLWMAPDVWDWADGDPDVRTLVLRTCARPGCGKVETEANGFKRCSACMRACYCSSECQKMDWKTHKPACRERKQLKALAKKLGQGKPPPKDNSIIYGRIQEVPGGGHVTTGNF